MRFNLYKDMNFPELSTINIRIWHAFTSAFGTLLLPHLVAFDLSPGGLVALKTICNIPQHSVYNPG